HTLPRPVQAPARGGSHRARTAPPPVHAVAAPDAAAGPTGRQPTDPPRKGHALDRILLGTASGGDRHALAGDRGADPPGLESPVRAVRIALRAGSRVDRG